LEDAMNTNTLLFGWKRSSPGRESLSTAHFGDFVQYLGTLQKDGRIQSFEPVLLDPNGTGMNGFFLIRADEAKLNEVTGSDEWVNHITRSLMHLEEPVLVRGVSGELVNARMAMWAGYIPK
jgi:hypothetical protein